MLAKVLAASILGTDEPPEIHRNAREDLRQPLIDVFFVESHTIEDIDSIALGPIEMTMGRGV